MVGVAVGNVAQASEADFLISGHFTTTEFTELLLVYGTKLKLYRILNSTIVYLSTTNLYSRPIAISTISNCLYTNNYKESLDAIAIFFPGDRLVIASSSPEGQFHQLLLSQIDSSKIANGDENGFDPSMWNNTFSSSSPLLCIKLQDGMKKLYSILLSYPYNYLYVLTLEFGKFMDGDKSINIIGSHLISNSNKTTQKSTLPLMVIDSIRFTVDIDGITESSDRLGPNVAIKSLISVSDNVCAMLVSNCPERIGIHSPEGSNNILFFSVSKVNGSISLLSIRSGIPLDAFNLISQANSNSKNSSLLVQCHDRMIQVNPYTTSGFNLITSKFYLFKTDIDLTNASLVDLPLEFDLCHVEVLSDTIVALFPLNSFSTKIILIELGITCDGNYTFKGFKSLNLPLFYANLWHKIMVNSMPFIVSSGSGMSISIWPLESFMIPIESSECSIVSYSIPADLTIFDSQPSSISITRYMIQESQIEIPYIFLQSSYIPREFVLLPMLRIYMGESMPKESKMIIRKKRRVQVRIANGDAFDMARLRSIEIGCGCGSSTFLSILGPSGVAQPTNISGKCHLIGVIYTRIPLYLVSKFDILFDSARVMNNMNRPQIIVSSGGNKSMVTIGEDIQITRYRGNENPEDEYLCICNEGLLTIYNKSFEGVFQSYMNSHILRHSGDLNYIPYKLNHIQCKIIFTDNDLGYTIIVAESGFPLKVYRSNTGRMINMDTTFTLIKFDVFDIIPDVRITISQPLNINDCSLIVISGLNYYLQLTISHNEAFLHRLRLPQYPSLRFNDGNQDIFSEGYIPVKSELITQLHPIMVGKINSPMYLGIDSNGLSIFALDTLTLPITPFNDWISYIKSDCNQSLFTSTDIPYQLWNLKESKFDQLQYDSSIFYTKIAVSIRCYYLSEGRISREPSPGSVGKLWAVSSGRLYPISDLLRRVLDERASEQIEHLYSEFGSKITTSELLSHIEPHSILTAQLESLIENEDCNINFESYQVCVGHVGSQGIVYGRYDLPPFVKVTSISFGIIGGREMLLVGTAQGLGEMIDCIGEFYILDLMSIFDSDSTVTLELVQRRQFSGPIMSIKPAGGDIDWPNNPYYNFCLDMIEERNLGLDTSLGTVYLDEMEVLEKDFKSSIHAVVYSDQFLHSVGSRLFVHEITNGNFVRGAFGDMPFCITDISMIDNFIVSGDVLKGVGLFMYRHFGASDTRSICRVASTNVSNTLSVLSVSATVCDDSLAIIASDVESKLHLLTFSLEKARAAGPDTLVQDKIASSKLLTQCTVDLGIRIIGFRRLNEIMNYAFGADGSILRVGVFSSDEIRLCKVLEDVILGCMEFPMGISLTSCNSLNINVLKEFMYMSRDEMLKIINRAGIKSLDIMNWIYIISRLLNN